MRRKALLTNRVAAVVDIILSTRLDSVRESPSLASLKEEDAEADGSYAAETTLLSESLVFAAFARFFFLDDARRRGILILNCETV